MCRRVERDGKIMYYPHEKELTDQIIADCAKLDELYFNANHMDTFNLDFCTVDYKTVHISRHRISSSLRKKQQVVVFPSTSWKISNGIIYLVYTSFLKRR